jgi:hypothetical protein
MTPLKCYRLIYILQNTGLCLALGMIALTFSRFYLGHVMLLTFTEGASVVLAIWLYECAFLDKKVT